MRFDRVYIDGSGVILNPNVRDDVRETLRAFKGEHVDISIELHKDKRSQRANNYYWSQVLTPMARESGNTVEEIHEAMCQRFLPNEHKRVEFFNRVTGECLAIETDSRRSSKLSIHDFYDFVESVRAFAAEFLQLRTDDPDADYWRKRTPRRAA